MKIYSVLLFGLALVLFSLEKSYAGAITYDFRSSGAQTALDGLASGVFEVDGVALGVQAGVSDGSGTLITGGDILSIDLTEGLGVNGEPLRDVRGSLGTLTTAVQFDLDPSLAVDSAFAITLNRYFAEDLVVFADGAFFGRLLDGVFNDFAFNVVDASTGLTEVALGELGGASSLLITTSVEFDDDSDFFIAELRAVAVPEPGILSLLATGIMAIGLIRRRRAA